MIEFIFTALVVTVLVIIGATMLLCGIACYVSDRRKAKKRKVLININ